MFGLEIQEIDEATLKLFMNSEMQRRVELDTEDDDCVYLSQNDELFTTNELYGFYYNKTIVGFAVLSKYTPGKMLRLYVKPECRSIGIGGAAVNNLRVSSLGCLKDNTRAIKFYESLGFEITQGYGRVFTFDRNISCLTT